MAKHSFIEYDSTAANNTDVGGVSVAEGTAPSNINDAIREVQSHLKNFVDDLGGSLDLGGTADVATVTVNQTFTSLTDGFYVVAKCTGDNTTVVTLNVNSKGAKKVQKNVDGVETALAAGDMQSGSHYGFIYDTALDSASGGWWLVDLNHSINIKDDTTPQLGGSLDTNAKSVEHSKGADVASAAELLVLRDGNYFDVTGTTTITSIEHTADAWKIGSEITLQFDGVLTLTHHATNLILPGGANITTAAGDTAKFVKVASGDWKCIEYTVAATAPGGGGGAGLQSVQVFTSSGTWTKPAGINYVQVIVTGGGGGGGGTSSANYGGAGGGGAGSTGKAFLDVTTPSSSTITIGAGGAGNTNGTGTSGGTSTWADGTNTNVVGNGGVGGTAPSSGFVAGNGGAGGAISTGGDINTIGGDGSGGGGTSSAFGSVGGVGGSSYWGGGGSGGGSSSSAVTGGDGNAYGSGGGGGNGDAGNGGAGKAGVIYVMEYA